jgi:ribose transport system ATP-binding protein
MSGALRPDSGAITVGGETAEYLTPKNASEHGITTIYQEFNLIPDLSVVENVFLGRLRRRGRWLRRVDWPEMRNEARTFFEELGFPIDPDLPISALSIAEQQLVELAKALSVNARIIILDEPTATLTQREISALFALLRRLKGRGIGIIYISHRMDEIREIGDRVTILRDGRHIGTWKVADTTTDDLIGAMIGRHIDLSGVEDRRICADFDEVVLSLRGVSTKDKLRDIDLKIEKGEILGLAGLIGSGRTKLVRAVFGADPIESGEIRVKGIPAASHSCAGAVKSGIGLLPEDRKSQGLLLDFSNRRNISLASLPQFSRVGFIRFSREDRAARDYIRRLGIKTTGPTQEARHLSGGNQQKVVLAKWLQTGADILIFDEPTRGIDVGAREEFYKIILECATRGVAIILVSSELPELMRLCDRIVVLREGRISGEVARRDFDSRRLLSFVFGHAA